MSKYKAKFYAQALYELTEGKDEKSVTKAIKGMLKILQENKQLKLWPSIVEAYGRLACREQNLVIAQVISEGEIGEKEQKRVGEFLQKEFPQKMVEIIYVQAAMGPGIKVRAQGKTWDLSLGHQIESFKKHLIS